MTDADPTIATLTELLQRAADSLASTLVAGFLTVQQLRDNRELWPDQPDSDEYLQLVLDAAQIQVEAYAPALPDGATAPPNYLLGHLMQTKNLWNAQSVDPNGGMGEGDFVLRPFPLDWQVKLLLKPKTRVPVIG